MDDEVFVPVHERFDLSDVVPARAREAEDDHELDEIVAEINRRLGR